MVLLFYCTNIENRYNTVEAKISQRLNSKRGSFVALLQQADVFSVIRIDAPDLKVFTRQKVYFYRGFDHNAEHPG